MTDAPWWSTAFGQHYADVYAHRDDDSAVSEVVGLLPRLRLAPGPVLDVGCGNGRHLAALRAAGIPAFGLDFSPHLLTAASARPECAGRLARGDMRLPPVDDGWGAVLLLFTAFGYFDDAQNAACLAALGRLLAPGGWLVLDLPDPDVLRSTLVPETARRTPAGIDVSESRSISRGRVEKTVTLSLAGKVMERYCESVRLFRSDEVAALAAIAGLASIDVWPGLDGFAADSGRRVYWLRR